jgi:polysaccharide pyruvyl transferase WcaK-like protein/glycosyltransferase involved in cell wall biosynthesis
MSGLLLCGAAGFTNRGDDAILWGMLTQLRGRFGDRPLRVAGGPELAPLCAPFTAQPLRYEDRPEVARAIEDADLVIFGGGGLMYDHDYDVGLWRLLTEPPDRQWLYEVAKLAAAARAAARPAMLYSMGVGPLVSEAGRRVARSIGESVQAVTVRDPDSADALAACGLSPSRVHLAADPAVMVDPAPAERGEEFLQRAGLADRPRPWIGLNLRPWHRFMGVESEPGAADRLVAEAVVLVAALRARLGGTVVLLPFQSLYSTDEEVFRDVLAQSGAEGTVLVDTPALPPDLVAALGRLDLMVGMRMHACLLALNAGVPFVSLSYTSKASEFARAAGLGDYAHSLQDLDAAAVADSCEHLLREREAIRPRLQEARARLRREAELPVALAAEILAQGRAMRATPAPRAAAPLPTDLRVLMQIRPDYLDRPGGDTTQLRQTRRFLEELGVKIEVSTQEAPDLREFDLVHAFNLGRPQEPYLHCLNAVRQDRPVALSTVYASFDEMWTWADPTYWELPPPGEGVPMLRPAPPPDPEERLRRAQLDLQRAAAIEWSTVYLPNGQSEADELHAAYGMDLDRTLIVPNAVSPIFFDAHPEPFVAKYGWRDFVLCTGRLEARKNQLLLVIALRGSGLPLVLIGQPNPESYRDLCRQYADGNVLFLDAVPHEELASAYAAAKVHALPSWFETPGLSSLEAAAAGCNIVSTDRGSPREYFGDEAWYCDPRDLDSIRRAVLAACEAPRSERLRERVRERYTWGRTAEATLEGYRLALQIHAARSSEERRRAAAEAAVRHHSWLERLAADRLYEIQRRDERVGALEGWAQGLEERAERLEAILAECRGEIDRITSRRSYRWTSAAAQGIWGILKRLGVSR